MPVTLETERLVLRMFEARDFEAYAAMCGDPEVMRFIGDGQPLAPPMAWRSLAMVVGHWSLRGYWVGPTGGVAMPPRPRAPRWGGASRSLANRR